MFAPQPLGGGKAGRAATYDDNLFGSRPVVFPWCRRGFLALLANKDHVAALLHRPAGERRQRRGAQGFARAQVEAGVMPGTADGVPGDEALGERPAIVRACGGDSEDLWSATHQKHRFAIAMADQFAAIGKVGESNAEGEVGSAGL